MFACFHHLTLQLMSIVHTCTRLFIPIAKFGFRGNAQSAAVMLQLAYKSHTTSILWCVCVFPPSHIAVDVDCSHVHPIIHTCRKSVFAGKRGEAHLCSPLHHISVLILKISHIDVLRCIRSPTATIHLHMHVPFRFTFTRSGLGWS
jgi:hypothetical protein